MPYRCPHQRPLVKPDVRNYRIRLSDDLSTIGISKELTTLNSQVDKPFGLHCMIQWRTAKLPTTPLAPRQQKATPPFHYIPVDITEGHAWITEAKVILPATERWNLSTLRSSLLGFRRFVFTMAITFDNRTFQLVANQGKNTLVSNPAFQTRHQLVMRNCVKVTAINARLEWALKSINFIYLYSVRSVFLNDWFGRHL